MRPPVFIEGFFLFPSELKSVGLFVLLTFISNIIRTTVRKRIRETERKESDG